MTKPSPIKIGISSCLLGNNVRYNGEHSLNRFITNTLGLYMEFVPVCPEAECGLGIPRPTMHLRGTLENPRLVVTKTGVDHTDRMIKWAKKRLKALEQEDLCGFIFKKNSPSSGLMRVKVFNEKKTTGEKRPGDFCRSVCQTLSPYPGGRGRAPERSPPTGEFHRADFHPQAVAGYPCQGQIHGPIGGFSYPQ